MATKNEKPEETIVEAKRSRAVTQGEVVVLTHKRTAPGGEKGSLVYDVAVDCTGVTREEMMPLFADRLAELWGHTNTSKTAFNNPEKRTAALKLHKTTVKLLASEELKRTRIPGVSRIETVKGLLAKANVTTDPIEKEKLIRRAKELFAEERAYLASLGMDDDPTA